MATKTIPDLPAATSVVAATLFPIVNDPAGTPVTQKATGTQLDAYIRSAGGALTATTLDGSGGALTINTAQADKDVVVSSTGMVNLLFTDAGNNRVGINTATPTVALQVVGTATATLFSGDGSALTSLPAISTAAFLTVAGNPATPVDANCWYNSTANTFRGYVTVPLNAWAATTSLPAGREFLGGGSFGSVSSAMVIAGRDSSGNRTQDTSKYNGTSWSAGGNVSTVRSAAAHTGTASSAIAAGGFDSGGSIMAIADTYNGTTWSAVSSLASAKAYAAMSGTSSSAAIIYAWYNGAALQTTTESWNGSSWASGATFPAAIATSGGCGSTTAALSAGGATNTGWTAATTAVYLYNGSSWSSSTSLPAARANFMASGTTTSAMAYGGVSMPYAASLSAYKFDGSAWSTTGSLAIDRDGSCGAGASSTSAMVAGGAPARSTCETYSETVTSSSKTFTVT